MKISKINIIYILIVLILFGAIFYGTVGLLIYGIKTGSLYEILIGSISTTIFALICVFGINKIIKE